MHKACAALFEGVDCTILGNPSEEVSGLAYRSDRVLPGDMFFCIVGLSVDGHSFAQDAIDRGAKVLVVERKLYLADATNITEVVVSDSRKAMAEVAANFYDYPSKSFQLVGITGTNGKTTTTYLVEHIMAARGRKCGVIGTVGNYIGSVLEKSEHTTPESPDLQRLFARMRDAHCEVVAMEVSSHALDLMRVWDTTFAVTAFTNLTQDHLDYHHTFDAYFEAKALLFSSDYPARRVININDKWGRELLSRCSMRGDSIITCGFDATAQVHPKAITYAPTHTDIVLEARGASFAFSYPLVGRFNVENIMTAFAIAMELGIPGDDIASALTDIHSVRGRLEQVKTPASSNVSVYVDYAHTPDALTKVIRSLRTLQPKRLIVVFGCGGERDSSKRPMMGQAALEADYAIVTSDNPRHEDPRAIINDIVGGMKSGTDRFEVQPDRREAITRAIELARPGDTVLIAGKGHEDYQLIGDEVLAFDDREVAADIIASVFTYERTDETDASATSDCPSWLSVNTDKEGRSL